MNVPFVLGNGRMGMWWDYCLLVAMLSIDHGSWTMPIAPHVIVS